MSLSSEGHDLPQRCSRWSAWQFHDPAAGEGFQSHGAELTSRGLRLDLPPLCSRVLVYRNSR